MLKAYYPVLYLTSFEYDRTRQKIVGIINSLKSDNSKHIRLFNWNCVEGLCEMSENGFRYLVLDCRRNALKHINQKLDDFLIKS